MDFGQLLSVAQQNGKTKKEVQYYKTKFEPPKKEQRSKQLSENIKKFLERQREEEKRKQQEEARKKAELLALRANDKKATKRVNVMLKRTKSANQSVIQDAIDKEHTAITLAGPDQPDEDDYGYVSQESSAMYNKMMEKYRNMPEEPKFNFGKKKCSSNLSGTKDRVKAALEREREEALLPHKRKRKQESQSTEDWDKEIEKEEKSKSSQEQSKPKPKNRPPPPPPMNFADLLKIAEKKQFEPIVIEPKVKEEEKLLTKKQKKEMEKEKEARERREARERERLNALNNNNGRIPKIGEKSSKDDRIPKIGDKKVIPNKTSSSNNKNNLTPSSSSNSVKSSNSLRPELKKSQTATPSNKPSLNSPLLSNGKILANALTKKGGRENGKVEIKKEITKPKEFPPRDLKSNREEKVRKLPPQDGKPKQFPPPDVRPKQFPPSDLKPRQFPPADVRRRPERPEKKLQLSKKRQIIDDDDSEYDSEMDDFIDDGPLDGENDYSKYISEIFGYDKSRYREIDEDVDNMESSFAQQMREEVISTKIGIMEDLEDMKKEEEEKRRKMLKKKQK